MPPMLRGHVAAAAAMLLLLTGPAPGPPPGAAARTIPAAPSDFNGDGDADLAIGVPGEDGWAGSIAVLYGSSAGITAVGSQRWSQASKGVKGARHGDPVDTDGDYFGSSLASADFDADGFADLAIGVPVDTVSGVRFVGSINVLYGSRHGLTADGNQRWSRANLPGAPRVGWGLAAGDLDGDGFGDLVLNGRLPDVPSDAADVVISLFGSARGLSNSRAITLTRADAGVSSPRFVFGAPLVVGDLDGDARDELVVGSGQIDPASSADCDACVLSAAEVIVFTGTPTGPDGGASVVLEYGTTWEAMPAALTLGDFDGDGRGDLAAAVHGGVRVRYGSPDGLAGGRDETWPLAAEPSMASGDLDGDGHDDLAVTSVASGIESGAVNVLYGTDAGLSTDRAQQWTRATPGIPGHGSQYDEFGASLAIADYGKSARDDLAIGAPGNIVRGMWRAGDLNVLYGRAAGLSTRGAQLWSQSSPGVPGTSDKYDDFGRSLTP